MTTQDLLLATARHALHFSSGDFPSPKEAFDRMRELTAGICDITMPGDVDDFQLANITLHLGGAVLNETQSSAMRYNRAAKHVAGGIDNFQVIMYLAGGVEIISRGQVFLQRAGDIRLLDMTQTHESREMTAQDGLTHVLTVVLPRMQLVPLFPEPEAIYGTMIVARETAYGRMLADQMRGLWRLGPELTQSEGHVAVQSFAQLATGAVGHRQDTKGTALAPSQEALMARITRYIEDNLGSESLGVESLCRRFGQSRAGFYRLFAPNSPASRIQERRMQRAYAMLLAPAFRRWRIIDIALECQFSSDATFTRAFHRRFGVTPSEIRELATRKIAGIPPGKGSTLPQPDAEAVRWVSEATGAAPQLYRSEGRLLPGPSRDDASRE